MWEICWWDRETTSMKRQIYRPLNPPKSYKTFDLFLLHMKIRTQVCLFWKNSIKTFDYNLLLIFCNNLWWFGRPCVHAGLSSAKIIRYSPTKPMFTNKFIAPTISFACYNFNRTFRMVCATATDAKCMVDRARWSFHKRITENNV